MNVTPKPRPPRAPFTRGEKIILVCCAFLLSGGLWLAYGSLERVG